MRPPRIVLAALLVLTFTGPAISAEPVDLTATIAAWNIKAMPHEIPESRARTIAQGISYLDPEVIVLTEVRPFGTMDTIVEELNGYGASYAYTAPPASDQPADLKIAILYKSGVEVSQATVIPGSNLGDPTYRNAVVATVRIGQFDFILVGVHLKSGRGNSERAVRTKQAEVIAKHLQDLLQGDEKDVLLVGDYNMIPPTQGNPNDEDNFEAMNPNGYLEFVSSADLVGLGSHISGSRLGNLLDGYAISYEHTNEYIDGTLRIVPLDRAMRMSLREFGRDVSDHLPLVARFDIAAEDDD